MRDERQDDLQRLGLDTAAAAAWLADTDGATDDSDDGAPADEAPGMPLCVWPENGPVLAVWMRLQTQWHRRPSGKLDGLRYEAADIVIRHSLVPDPAALWAQLIEMEHAAMEVQHG